MVNWASDDRVLIIQFLSDSELALGELVERPEDYLVVEVYRHPDVSEWLLPAWREAQRGFSDARAELDKLSEDDLGALARRGLRGRALRFKLGVFYRLLEKFREGESWIWAHRFLQQLDTILDSLSASVPPLQLVCEFKESLEHITKWRGRLPTWRPNR